MKPDELDDGADFDLFLYLPSTSGGLDSCTFLEASSTLSHPQAKALPEAIALAPVMRTVKDLGSIGEFMGVYST
jgi:hypothetical protein